MQAYSAINSILLKENSTFQEFQKEIVDLAIEKETYLNLFLTTVVCKKSNSHFFNKYVDLLVNFAAVTGKKSANINYIGYKDQKSILMHACLHGNQQNIQHLLSVPNRNLNLTDPSGKNVLFYAVSNHSEENSNAILNLLLDDSPELMHVTNENNVSVLFDALQLKRFSTIELLLSRGSDVNLQLKDSENTISHYILRGYKDNKQITIKLLMLFLKYKANFSILNRQGKSVFAAAIDVDLNLSECTDSLRNMERNPLLAYGELDYEEDKQSLTTLNQQTKKGDNSSEIEQIQSNICSQKVDFSSVDFQQEEERQQRIKTIEDLNLHSFSSDQDNQSQLNQGTELDFELLSKQISQFSLICEQRHRNIWINIHPFLTLLQKLANKHNLVIEVVGSFATGLWSSYSDIDINLVPMDNEYINFETTLEKIYKALKIRKSEFGIDDVYFNKNKINTVKLGLNNKYSNLIVDIAIFYRNNQNRAYVTYILESINAYPQIKPLFFIFKKISETFDLHDHIVGGLKTYTLFLMIYSIIKNLSSQSLGELFNQISLYYGFYYAYEFACEEGDLQKMALKNSQEVEHFPKAVFNFRDPLNPSNNVGGKNTRVEEMQNMFKSLYFSLNQLESAPYLYQLFELNSIF